MGIHNYKKVKVKRWINPLSEVQIKALPNLHQLNTKLRDKRLIPPHSNLTFKAGHIELESWYDKFDKAMDLVKAYTNISLGISEKSNRHLHN